MDAEVPASVGMRTEVLTPTGPEGPHVELVVVTGKSVGRSIVVAGPRFVIGRDPSCHLRPNNPAISRIHAAIERRDGRVFVRDLGSSNGTLLNARLLRGEEAEVAHADRLQVGPLLFAFVVESGEDEGPQSAELRARRDLEEGVDALDTNTSVSLPVAAAPPAPPAAKVDPTIGRPHLHWELDRGVLVINMQVPELHDESTVGPVRFALTALSEQPLPRRVVVRLGHVGWFSPRGSGMLMAYSQRLERAGGALRLCEIGAEAAESLEQLHVPLPLETFATAEEAITAPWE
jgi:pSer/pThr/pTyr-binding forkhead associated (FHA) protein